jgi:hypothetical protein
MRRMGRERGWLRLRRFVRLRGRRSCEGTL